MAGKMFRKKANWGSEGARHRTLRTRANAKTGLVTPARADFVLDRIAGRAVMCLATDVVHKQQAGGAY
jgi:hypothetical protein